MQPIRSLFTISCYMLLLSGLSQSSHGQSSAVTGIIHHQIGLSTQRTTVMVFAAAISKNGVDRGSGLISAKTVDGIENVLKVKAAADSLPPTNLTVFTTDGRVYRFSVVYDPLPGDDFFDFSDPDQTASSDGVRFEPDRLNDAAISAIVNQVPQLPGRLKRPRIHSAGGMHMQTQGIYLSGGVLFFQLALRNDSGIPFTLDFVRCYQRDRRQSKRTSQMEKEIKPLQVSFAQAPTVAAGMAAYTLALAFEQFTISDRKYFMIELFEKNGDRHLVLRIKGKHLLKAKPLLMAR